MRNERYCSLRELPRYKTPQTTPQKGISEGSSERKNARESTSYDSRASRLAERGGFEPPVALTRRRFSRPVHSATLPPLRFASLDAETRYFSCSPFFEFAS
jgi:hypothetical protein